MTTTDGGLTVTGGAGGVAAHYADLRAEATVLDREADAVRSRADDVAKVAADPDVLAAAVLCPVQAARVGTGAGQAGLALVTLSARLEGTALVLRATVEAYEVLDATRARVLEGIQVAAGWGIGAVLPLLAVAGGGAVLVGGGVVASNPALRTLLADPRVRAALADAAVEGAMTTLFENPWLLEGITGTAPWLVQGAATTLLGGPGPHSWAIMTALSGGRWPAGDYTDAVGGLVAIGQRFGAFEDAGDFPVTDATGQVTGAWAPTSLEDVFAQQDNLGAEANHGHVQVVRSVGPDGVTRWVVQIPGTQEWSPVRGTNPVDLTTNVALMSGAPTLMQEQVAEAMRRAGVGPDDPVMLTGHSQGGITAAAMAADPSFTADFRVEAVVTGGSPIGRFDIPDDVSVLAIEHAQDPVPMLEGRANPDRVGWVTVTRDMQGHDVVRDPGTAHYAGHYAETGALVDASTDPSVRAWFDQHGVFLEPGDGSEVMHYRVAGDEG